MICCALQILSFRPHVIYIAAPSVSKLVGMAEKATQTEILGTENGKTKMPSIAIRTHHHHQLLWQRMAKSYLKMALRLDRSHQREPGKKERQNAPLPSDLIRLVGLPKYLTSRCTERRLGKAHDSDGADLKQGRRHALRSTEPYRMDVIRPPSGSVSWTGTARAGNQHGLKTMPHHSGRSHLAQRL